MKTIFKKQLEFAGAPEIVKLIEEKFPDLKGKVYFNRGRIQSNSKEHHFNYDPYNRVLEIKKN